MPPTLYRAHRHGQVHPTRKQSVSELKTKSTLALTKWSLITLAALCPAPQLYAQSIDEAVAPEAVNDTMLIDAKQAPEGKLSAEDIKAFKDYRVAADRYQSEITSYKVDLRRTLISDYQVRLSSVDKAYEGKISTLRAEESRMRDDIIKRMESFLVRYGDDNEQAADVLYRLARLHYEKADEIYLYADDGSQEHPDFSTTLSYIARLEKNFPAYDQMDGALYLKGYCQGQMGQHEESRESFMALLEKHPKSNKRAEVLTRIGEYYFSRSQDALLGLEGEIMWVQALKYYSEAVALGPDTTVYDRALYRKAWTEYYSEDYDSMLHDFITLVGFADQSPNGSALRAEAIDFMAAALAEEDWDLSDDISIDPDFGMQRFNKYLKTGAPFEAEVLRKFADTLTEQARYEYAAEAYEAYLNLNTCAEDIPEVIRVYTAALNLAGRIDKAALEQASIESRIGPNSEWYACMERDGNLEAIAVADAASQQALKNSIMAYHDRVSRTEDDLRQATELLEDSDLSTIEREVAEMRLAQIKAQYRRDNQALAQITSDFIKGYPNDPENYNYRYLLGQAYFSAEMYPEAIAAFTDIRDVKNALYQADAARYLADAYENMIDTKSYQDQNYIPAITLVKLAARTNQGKIGLENVPTSLLISQAITYFPKEDIDKELEFRKEMSFKKNIPDDVHKLIEAREIFSKIETESGQNDPEQALAPQYRYDNAIIYYNYGDFEEAEKRFTQIIDNSPASIHASSAADIILAEYEMRGDHDKVAALSDQYASMQLGSADSDSIVNSRFKDKKYNALFLKAFKLFDNKHYLEAASEFLKIIEENPDFEHNNRALYNAGYAYEQMKHYDSAMQIYRRVLDSYGKTEEAVEALYRIGLNAEKFFDFQTAVNSFMSLYDNKTPLYQNFKNRVNALRNAAKIKLLIQDNRGAAQLLGRYHSDFPGQADAPQFLYEAGKAYAELKQYGDAERTFKEFRRLYSGDPRIRPYIIASHVVEADTFRDRKRASDARKSYEAALELYRNAPNAAAAIGRDAAAKSAYYLAEMEYETWAKNKMTGKMTVVTTKLKDHMNEMRRLYNQFSLVMNYNSPIWGIASRYAIARMMHQLVDQLENMDKPLDIRQGSDNHLAFLSSMSDLATGTRDETIKMYQNAIEASRVAGISLDWTKKSLDGLKELDRTASSQEKMAAMRDVYSPTPIVSPTQFTREQKEKAEAEERAEQALKALREGD